jgi:hypothetical protein
MIGIKAMQKAFTGDAAIDGKPANRVGGDRSAVLRVGDEAPKFFGAWPDGATRLALHYGA